MALQHCLRTENIGRPTCQATQLHIPPDSRNRQIYHTSAHRKKYWQLQQEHQTVRLSLLLILAQLGPQMSSVHFFKCMQLAEQCVHLYSSTKYMSQERKCS